MANIFDKNKKQIKSSDAERDDELMINAILSLYKQMIEVSASVDAILTILTNKEGDPFKAKLINTGEYLETKKSILCTESYQSLYRSLTQLENSHYYDIDDYEVIKNLEKMVEKLDNEEPEKSCYNKTTNESPR